MLAMLTPDASPARSPSAPPTTSNVSYLAQMPLALLGSYLRGQTPSPAHASQAVSQVDSGTATPQKYPSPAPASASDMPAAHDTPIASLPHSLSHSHPHSRRTSTSSSSAATDDRPKKRAPRPKTSYLIAQPPPTVNPYSKLHIRPKILLQLHQVLAAGRPKPEYDVVPFSLLEARATRRLARAFNTRERLGHNDLFIVKANDYGSKSDKATTDDERWSSREVIGVISPGKTDKGIICPGKTDKAVPGKAEICMDDGTSRWEVTNLPNGGYEFNTVNDHGLAQKARWVLKPSASRRWSGVSSASQPSAGPEDNKKFTFSTISADSRRHPIIATLTRARIDVLDSYAIPSATSPSTPSHLSSAQESVLTPASIDMDSFIDIPSDRLPIPTDDALRKFIVASGIWVIAQNWTPDYSTILPPAVLPNTPSTSRPLCSRTVSMSTFIHSRSSSPSSTCDEKHRSFPKLIKTGTSSLSRRRLSFDTPPSPMSTKTTMSTPTPVVKSRPRRANSIATSNLHSMSGSMRKRYALAFENNILSESEEEKQTKRSVEILRVKELALEQPSIELPDMDPKLAPTPIDTPRPVTPTLRVPDSSRERKTQSAYNPVTTTGMWDSGVAEGPGLKARSTSMYVMNERKRKQEKKRGRGAEKEKEVVTREMEKERDSDYGSKAKMDWARFKNGVKCLFRRSTC